MNATRERTEQAMLAWQEGRRRRLVSSTVDRAADAALAAGGVFVANAMLPLDLGLPSGQSGITFGATLVLAGIAWLTRARRRTVAPQRIPAMRAVRPAMVLDAERAA